MAKINFKRSKKFEGVTYSICKNNKWNNHWEFKHQVPLLNEIPKEHLSWNDLRFPYELKYLPNDNEEHYTHIYFTPIKNGDVIYAFGGYIGIVEETRVSGDKENGYYIEVIYNKVFETINNERILIDKERIDKLCMKNFLWFYLNLSIMSLNEIKYKTALDIIPYYQSIISEQKLLVKQQQDKIKEFEKIIGNIDKRIQDKAYDLIQKNRPIIKDPFEDLPIMKRQLIEQEKSARIKNEEQKRRWDAQDKRNWENDADESLRTLYRCMEKYERGY